MLKITPLKISGFRKGTAPTTGEMVNYILDNYINNEKSSKGLGVTVLFENGDLEADKIQKRDKVLYFYDSGKSEEATVVEVILEDPEFFGKESPNKYSTSLDGVILNEDTIANDNIKIKIQIEGKKACDHRFRFPWTN